LARATSKQADGKIGGESGFGFPESREEAKTMNAREKLNTAHLTGSVIIAGFFGLVTGSAVVFGLVLIVLIVAQLNGGGIRTTKQGRK
jgi:hypothetical protein